jgi:hypothetical protein
MEIKYSLQELCVLSSSFFTVLLTAALSCLFDLSKVISKGLKTNTILTSGAGLPNQICFVFWPLAVNASFAFATCLDLVVEALVMTVG